MTEIAIRNEEFLGLLDDTVERFLPHRELMTELSANEGNVPIGDGEYYCQKEHLFNMMSNPDSHIGFPEHAYGFQVAHGARSHPEIFEPLKMHTKNELVRIFGANNNSLTSYYPPYGYVGWHTNWNAFGYQLILTWSESGDGYFSYYDNETESIVTHHDREGWQARWYRFGRKDEPQHHCWHAAWTKSPRFTLAFKFPYGGDSRYEDRAFNAIQDLIYEMETP